MKFNDSHRQPSSTRPHAQKLPVLIAVAVLIALIAGIYLLKNFNKQNGGANSTPATVTTEVKKPQPITVTLPNTQPIQFTYADYGQADSMWVIVNKQRPIPTDYVPKNLVLPSVLTRADKSQQEQSVRKDISVSLKAMFDASQAQGLPLLMASGYRSAPLQKTYFDNYVRTDGLEYAQKYSALPGTSEHQTGLAVDISTSDRRCYLEDQCFINLPEGKWLAENAYKYGFIQRYPSGKEAITGYNPESWHYRYVGKELAAAVFNSGLVLDEVLPYFDKAKAELDSRRAASGS